ncbi:hypothetical protein GGR54DRAFT_652328 [Hypoxylon sp. NC1633]|nr:hypothetical protein GGR54DRAFT_652328 [Hypoxylon sp. NC1633]
MDNSTKKATEWYLVDWAVRNGVQSTTRYRYSKASCRRGTAHPSRSGRANSVRKGGLTARRIRNLAGQQAARDKQAQDQGQSSQSFEGMSPRTLQRPLPMTYPTGQAFTGGMIGDPFASGPQSPTKPPMASYGHAQDPSFLRPWIVEVFGLHPRPGPGLRLSVRSFGCLPLHLGPGEPLTLSCWKRRRLLSAAARPCGG